MITEAILVPIDKAETGFRRRYIVTNTGKQAFWPHDGDTITQNDISWLQSVKGWRATIQEV